MSQAQPWKFGYEACGRRTGYQLCLKYATCSLGDPYLQQHCGGCNPGCNPATAGVTPADPHMAEILGNIGGLQINIHGYAAHTDSMPERVTLVWDNRDTVPPMDSGPVAVAPEMVFPVRGKGTELRCTPEMDVRRKLGLPQLTHLWLHPGDKDGVLEWMWHNPVATKEALAANRFDVIMSPHFSVYGVQCPLTWRINARRTLLVYAELAQLCTSSVVTVTVPNEFFAEGWARWLADNPEVNCVAINAQMWRAESHFQAMFALVVGFADLVGRDVHYILCGPTTPDRTALVQHSLPSCTIVSSFWYNRENSGVPA